MDAWLPAVIVMDNCFVSLPAVLVAFTVKVDVPAAVGVPVIAPVSARFKPAGNVPLSTLHVMGVPPVATSVRLYAVPTTPFGNDVVVIATAVIVMDNCFVSLPSVLVAITVKVDVFAVVGVPVMVPVAARVKPAGNSPLSILHVMGVPPLAASVWLYAVPITPFGNTAVVIVGTPPIVIVNSLVSLPAALVAFTVKVDVSAVVGIPVMSPVVSARFKPAGNAPLSRPHVMGLSPVAASVWLYSVPSVPSGNDVVVIVGATPLSGPLSQAAKENPITVIATINPNHCANRAVVLFFIKKHPSSYGIIMENLGYFFIFGRRCQGGRERGLFGKKIIKIRFPGYRDKKIKFAVFSYKTLDKNKQKG
jgi:hypothetical protein